MVKVSIGVWLTLVCQKMTVVCELSPDPALYSSTVSATQVNESNTDNQLPSRLYQTATIHSS